MGVSLAELKNYIAGMQGLYDVVRVVEPGSCHVVKTDGNASGSEAEMCYTVWGKCERCGNCTSYQATIRNRAQEKIEIREGVECHVLSIPVPVEEDGKKTNAYCIELVNYGRKVSDIHESGVYAVADNNEDALYVSIVGNKKVSDEIISLAMLDSSIGIICMDGEGSCIYSNRQAFKLLHIANELGKLQDFLNIWISKDHNSGKSNIWSQFYSHEGSEYLYELHLMTAVDDKTKQIIGSCLAILDITDEALNSGGVKFRETHDSLTGIFNQDGFFKSVRAILSANPEEEYIIMCSNIKKFKLLNQLFGMEKGDAVLRSIARSLEKWCHKDDVYGRTHSDEFVLFMRKADYNEEIFRSAVHETASTLDNSIYRLQFQIGIYEIKNIHLPIYEMLDRARMAVESIVDNNELSIAYYSEDMLSNTLHENEIINNFSKALNNQEFHIFLQPQVDKEGKVIGGEALARWIHPQKGIIPPGMFIGVLENANLIYKLDRYVWELAAKQLSLWQGTDKEKFSISVNISPKDLQFLDIGIVFSELVEKYNIDPSKLNLEITETAVAANIGRCIEIMKELREKGFLIEMDDFGSGYSSLNLLKDIELDVLKIDMKFLSSTGDKKKADIILEHIITMAQRLNMIVIAEGVETREQMKMLTDMGCDLFQGYYFSKPVDVEAFEALQGQIFK